MQSERRAIGMRLYHGSNVTIERPDLSRSKPFKDFGRGFYLSHDPAQAQERAAQVVDLLKQGSPSVTVFEWNEDDAIADGLKIKRFDDYCEEWAEFVLKNRDRHQPHPVHDYEIVYGPIADYGVTFQLRRYTDGIITMRQLVEELRYAKGLTIQYFFGTDRALSYLSRI